MRRGAGMIYPMSDETVTSFREGHAACPFVAFEDDRDHRADHPDYRHRCFAAADAAGEPRALPHQERFCLSAAFAQCPIFLDWARQEAAGVSDRNAAAEAADEADAATAAAAAGAPAFLAGRGRTTPAEATPAGAHASDPGSGLWGFEGAPRRTFTPVTPPAVNPKPSIPQTVAMARREPTRPAWENPPRMDNFPRLRSRDDRNNNQPLILAAVGVAVLMVALIVVPLISSGGGGSSPSKATGSPGASQTFIAGGPSDGATETPIATPTAGPTLLFYTVGKNKWDTTLTTIAAHFKIPLALLEAANPP